MSAELAIFPIYLFFASIANVVFLFFSARDCFDPNADKTSSRVLLALSIAELIWVVPCWVQCLMNWISNAGDVWWNPAASSYTTGCDIMGFYSVFASVSGMYIVAVVAYVSFQTLVKNARPSPSTATILVVLSYLMALVQCLLPALGVGSFQFSGEGFCYIDWSNTAQAVCMEVVTYPIFFAVCYWYGCCALYVAPVEESCASERPLVRVPPRCWWWFLLLAYVSAWVLWLPAIFIGLDSSQEYPAMFPAGYMIAGGALGHAQALLNPFFYGVKWRTWFNLKEPASALVEGNEAKLSAVLPDEKEGVEII